jgi:hypothetical protein
MPSPATPEGGGFGDLWAFLGTIAAAATIVLGNFIRGWRRGRDETAEGPEVRSRLVTLERADLANLGDLDRNLLDVRGMLGEFKMRFEQLYDVERLNRATLEGHRERMDEILRGMRRLEGELDIAKRLREEEILRASRHVEGRDG